MIDIVKILSSLVVGLFLSMFLTMIAVVNADESSDRSATEQIDEHVNFPVSASDTSVEKNDGVAHSESPETDSSAVLDRIDSIQVGDALNDVRRLLGRSADTVDTVGACGIMETRYWKKEGLKILTTGQSVTSVLQSKREED